MNLAWKGADRTALALAAACLLLALHGLHLFKSDTAPDRPDGRTGQPPGDPDSKGAVTLDIAGLAPALGPIEDYGAVVARPLFDPTRSPPAAAPDSTQAAMDTAPAPSQFTLSGIVIAQNQRSAILKNTTTSKVVRATEGMRIGEWTLETLEPDRVLLRHKDTRQEISLRRFDRPVHPAAQNAAQRIARPTPR